MTTPDTKNLTMWLSELRNALQTASTSLTDAERSIHSGDRTEALSHIIDIRMVLSILTESIDLALSEADDAPS